MSLTRTKSDLIGTPASPASIAAGASSSGNVDLTATAGTFECELGGAVIIGSAPSAGPTVKWSYSLDATNYIDDVIQTLPTTASTTFFIGPYMPPVSAKNAKCTVLNNDTGSVAITAWVQANTLASSNL